MRIIGISGNRFPVGNDFPLFFFMMQKTAGVYIFLISTGKSVDFYIINYWEAGRCRI